MHEDPDRLARLEDQERQNLADECCAYIHELHGRDQLIALCDVTSPVRFRVRDGIPCLEDDSCMPPDMPYGRCVMIEARDLNDAIRIAGRTPLARFGQVEVRPLQKWEPEDE